MGVQLIIIMMSSFTHCIATDDKVTWNDMQQVHSNLCKARTKWFDIGLALHVDSETIRNMCREFNDYSDKCSISILHRLTALKFNDFGII